MYRKFFKRLFDVSVSLLGIIILSPIFLFLAIIIKIDSKGPVIFKQQRVGKNKKIFTIFKFRTMFVDTPKDMPTHQLQNATSHITKVGAFLRKTSLDELPQIFNIFVGHMAIIGPRPALWNQEDLILERDKYDANSVRPGLTGLAQVMGRDELEIPIKAKYDGEYTKALKAGKFKGIKMDIKCFFKTIGSVLKREGVVEGATNSKEEKPEDNKEELL